MNKTFFFTFLCFSFVIDTQSQSKLDLQAHRGGRGLMPENSIPAMLHAVELGARTLELDCVISSDGQVVVSHDPFMNGAIMVKPDGSEIGRAEEKEYAIYKMTYDSIRRFSEGVKPYPIFPDQRPWKTYKPLLADLVDSVEAYVAAHHLKPVYYNMETKSDPEGDGTFHPAPDVFITKMMAIVNAKHIADRVTIQSFDPRTLKILHARFPGQPTALLVENADGFEKNLTGLGFAPTIYSPNYHLVDAALVRAAHDRKVAVLPWTVNTLADMQAMAGLGVDGIISDYPDRLVKLFGSWQR